MLEDVDSGRGTLFKRFWFVYTNVCGFLVATVGALAIGLIQLLTGGRARRLCLNHLLPQTSRLCLRVFGIRMRVHGRHHIPAGQCVYVSNHPSGLDLFLWPSLGLKNMRNFMSKKTLVFFPVAVFGRSTGVFFTPPQSEPEARARCFQRAENDLRKTGDSVLLTPEGTRCPNGIGPFNKGTFHLATNLKVPIVPMYVDVSPAINPGRSMLPLPGVVDIYIRPPIITEHWALDDLVHHKEQTRSLYLDFPQGWVDADPQSEEAA